MQVCSWLLLDLRQSCILSAEDCQNVLSVVHSPHTEPDSLGNFPLDQQQGRSAGEGVLSEGTKCYEWEHWEKEKKLSKGN